MNNNANNNVSETQANRTAVAASAHLEVVLALTEAQAKALKLMDKHEKRAEVLQGAVDARIKGAFKAYADKIETSLARVYDDASRRGAKFPETKDEFLKKYGSEAKAVMAEL